MAKNQQNTHPEADGLDLQAQFGKTETFITENQKSLTIIGSVVAAMVLLYFGYTKFYLAPREIDAQDNMFRAEQYFEADSLDKALNGDGNYPGFLKIIEEYGGTKSANLAYYYAGVTYLKKGEYQKAIDNLNDYSAKDDITGATALGAIGDAYSELKDYNKAADYYKKASDKNLKGFSATYLMKLGLVYEQLKENEKALDTYKKIKTDYADSFQARQIDEYIARVEAKM